MCGGVGLLKTWQRFTSGKPKEYYKQQQRQRQQQNAKTEAKRNKKGKGNRTTPHRIASQRAPPCCTVPHRTAPKMHASKMAMATLPLPALQASSHSWQNVEQTQRQCGQTNRNITKLVSVGPRSASKNNYSNNYNSRRTLQNNFWNTTRDN